MAYTFDGVNKIISFDILTIYLDVRDMWSRYSDWLAASGSNRQYLPAMRTVGGDALPGSKQLGITYFMLNGWKVRPFSADHVFTVNGNIYSEDGSSPFTSAIGAYNVTIINTVSNLVDSTVQQLPEIEHASFNGGVTIDAVNGTDSAEYPYGTPKFPCKTTTNSYMIRITRGFNKIFVKSNLTLIGIPDGILNGLIVEGVVGHRVHTVTSTNVLLTNCSVKNLNVTGTCKPGSVVELEDCTIANVTECTMIARDCTIHGGTYYNTDLNRCLIDGDIKIDPGGNMSGLEVVFDGDFSNIDMQGEPCIVSLDIRSGYVEIKNAVEGSLAEFNLAGGELEIADTCTGGDLYVEGHGKLYDYGTMNIKANNLISEYLPIDVWNSMKSDPWEAGSFADHVKGLTSTASAVYAYPDVVTRVIGSDQGGTVATMLAHDDSYFSTGEVAGQGLEVQAQVSSSVVTDIPQACRITGYYNGSGSHSITIQAYNYVLLSWEEKGIMLSRTSPFDYSIPLSVDNHDAITGEILLRFVHSVGTYLNSHRLHIDFMEFELNDGQSLLATDIASIKNKTDQLAFLMGKVNSNTQSIETGASTSIWNIDPVALPDTGIGGLVKKIYNTCKNIFSLSA